MTWHGIAWSDARSYTCIYTVDLLGCDGPGLRFFQQDHVMLLFDMIDRYFLYVLFSPVFFFSDTAIGPRLLSRGCQEGSDDLPGDETVGSGGHRRRGGGYGVDEARDLRWWQRRQRRR